MSVPIEEADDARGEEDPSADKREDEDPGSPPQLLRSIAASGEADNKEDEEDEEDVSTLPLFT